MNSSIDMHTFRDKRSKVIQPYYIILDWCLTSIYKLKHGAVKAPRLFLLMSAKLHKPFIAYIYINTKKPKNVFQG